MSTYSQEAIQARPQGACPGSAALKPLSVPDPLHHLQVCLVMQQLPRSEALGLSIVTNVFRVDSSGIADTKLKLIEDTTGDT